MTDPDRAAVVNALATTAGITLADNPLDQAEPQEVSAELERGWPLAISAMAARRALILVIEDAHWASPQLLAMLERIARRSTGPILLIVTARPEAIEAERAPFLGREDTSVLALRPLGTAASRSLIGGLLGTGLPAALEADVLGTAEGNPLFIEEIVARLIEQGGIRRDGPAWQATSDAGVHRLPDTITGILAARIDTLAPEAKRALQEASVIGRVFWPAPLTTTIDPAIVDDALADLERRGLVSVRATSTIAGQVEYAFKHALIREVAYAGLPRARRAIAHAAVAEWLTDLGSGDELAELVAAHAVSALDEMASNAPLDPPTRERIQAGAFEWLLAGGTTARKRYAIERALELHQRALTIAASGPSRARALEAIGDDHDAAYHGDGAVPAWDEAMTILEPDPAAGGDSIARLATKSAYMGAMRWGGFAVPMDPARIDAYVDRGLALVDQEDARARLLALRASTGSRWASSRRPDPVPLGERSAAGETAYEIGLRLGRYDIVGLALHNLVGLYLASGRTERAEWAERRMIEVADRIDAVRDRHLYLVEAFHALSWVTGDAASLVSQVEPLVLVGRRLSPHELLHSTCIGLSILYLTGRWDEAMPLVDEHVAAFALEEDMVCPFVRGGLGVGAILAARRGNADKARSLLAMIPAIDAPVGFVEGLQTMAALALDEPEVGRLGALALLGSGQRAWEEDPALEVPAYADALVALGLWEELDLAIADLRSRAYLIALADPTIDRAAGLSAWARGDREAAISLLRRSIEAFDGLAPYEAARAREALAAADDGRAGLLLAEARAIYTRLGATPDVARLDVAAGPERTSTIGA